MKPYRYWACVAGFCVGHLLWQAIKQAMWDEGDVSVALERSWFSVCLALTLWLGPLGYFK